jgi:hypothetical protein
VLWLDEARKGDLPPVCVWCGKAARAFYPVPLDYWWRRVTLRLPLCGAHGGHWRHRAWARLCLVGGVCLACLGVALGALTATPTEIPRPLLAVASALTFVIGLLTIGGSLGARAFLRVTGIRVRRFGPGSVLLTPVATEFVEAHRAYRQERPGPSTRPAPPPPETDPSQVTEEGVPWGEEVHQVLEVAGLEARGLGHDYFGTGHLLLALRLARTPAARALQILGIDAEQVREACRAATPAGPGLAPGRVAPVTPAVRRALVRAGAEARALNYPSVRAGHVLLAVLREPENEAVQALLDLGISSDEVRRRVAEAIQFLEGVLSVDGTVTR